MRTVRLVGQTAAISGALEHRGPPPWRRKHRRVAEPALPGGARRRRLDQRIGQSAEQTFVSGQLELRGTQADACRRLAADPAMHVVVEKILAGAAEIAAAAASERDAYQEQ